ncbi:hypothetical protein DMENIID0001_140850 [Sergentomyia squamirostris]
MESSVKREMHEDTMDNEDDNHYQLESEIKMENDEVQTSEVIVKQEDQAITYTVSEAKDPPYIYDFHGSSDEQSYTGNSQDAIPPEEERSNKRKRKRKICPEKHKKTIHKKKVEKGLEHFASTTRPGESTPRLIPAKMFNGQVNCICRNGCAEKVDVVDQEKIFKSFYEMDSQNKTMFLRGCVKREKVLKKRSKDNPINIRCNKQFSLEYFLQTESENGIPQKVCRRFFLQCLQITAPRVYFAVNTMHTNPTGKDNRGRASPANKTPTSARDFVKQFISSVPQYVSHYGRSQSNRKYLPPDMNLRKLYSEYKRRCDEEERNAVSDSIFRDVFYKDFNLAFKRRPQDTCKSCDKYKEASTEEKKKMENDHEKHMQATRDMAAKFRSDVDAAKANETLKVLTFDLQKSLVTPTLSASIAFYKRKLWTYNLCVYDEAEDKGFMYVWNETVASRGCQEIGSCLLEHFKKIPDTVTEIILYSDSCGGQNRNIKMSLLLKWFLASQSTILTIKQKFLISGHSFNSANRCFSLIEKKAKQHEIISTPDQWLSIIQSARSKPSAFHCQKMSSEIFFSTKEIEASIVNREHDEHNNPISWLKMKKLKYKRSDPYSLEMKTFAGNSHIVRIQKKGKDFTTAELPLLFPQGRAIPEAKRKDLEALMDFIPAESRNFYDEIIGNAEVEDYEFATIPTIRQTSQESRHEDPRNSSISACLPLRILPGGSLNVGSSKQGSDILTTENQNLKREIQVLKSENPDLKREQKELFEHLSEVFSQNQLDLLLKRKEKISSWEDKELWEAFVLRSIDRRAFTFVRDTLKYPLPSDREINEWALHNENRAIHLEVGKENISTVERESEIENKPEINIENVKIIAVESLVKRKLNPKTENPKKINTEITFEINEFFETRNSNNIEESTGDNEDDNQYQLESEVKMENDEIQISEVVVKQEDQAITYTISEAKEPEDISTSEESDEDSETDQESPSTDVDEEQDAIWQPGQNLPIICEKRKRKTYEYMLKSDDGISHKVCLNFLKTCLQISRTKASHAIKSASTNPNAIDLRGRHRPGNKTPEHIRNFAKDFIDSIPAFESNYSREKSKKKYLKPGVTIEELYKQYVKLCQESNTKSLHKKVFNTLLNSDYNFAFKQRKTEKCHECDYFVKKKDSMSREDKQAYEEHMAYTLKVSAEFKEDVKRSVNDETVKILIFDLQLPFATPKLPDNMALNKQQLWVYNFCVFDVEDKKGYLYVWSEDEGFKSGEDIASCLLTHIKKFVPESTKHLILYSDNCGGCPNRNMKITFLLKHMLANQTNLSTIEQKFFVTGHGYSSCNYNFQYIEREVRRHHLFAVPDQLMDIIPNAKKGCRFSCFRMRTDDFFSTRELNFFLVNPKIKENGEKINWKNVHRLKYEKIHPTTITMTSFNGTSDRMDIGKMTKVDFAAVELSLLYPAGRAITEAKKNDLKDLMQYIPQEYHEYYDGLIGDKDEIDFGLASGDDEDF